MEGSAVKDCCHQTTNGALAYSALAQAVAKGVAEFCLCAGKRNADFVALLETQTNLTTYYWPEERSAAFFAIGRMKATKKPVAVITTSGTAAGELLPATMEAYYSGLPLLLITADRPKRFRGSGAPQAAEQVDLFGIYTPFSQDADEEIDLSLWNVQAPAHLNICFEEPKVIEGTFPPLFPVDRAKKNAVPKSNALQAFLAEAQSLLVIVSALEEEIREEVVHFLLQLQAPVYLEATSGLREDPRLQQIRTEEPYLTDSLLRIGGVPTHKMWRNLENTSVFNLSDLPFSGLSWSREVHTPIRSFLTEVSPRRGKRHLRTLDFAREPRAEPSLIHALSKHIPEGDLVYLGNSLPIREWDFAATYDIPHRTIYASRGLNGIDGQISTFLGLCQENTHNWAVIGDLTALYDLIGPWILQQRPNCNISLVIVNNSGGQIFSRLFPQKGFLNPHTLSFKPLADLWGLHYERWETVPPYTPPTQNRLIELIPDNTATNRFWSWR